MTTGCVPLSPLFEFRVCDVISTVWQTSVHIYNVMLDVAKIVLMLSLLTQLSTRLHINVQLYLPYNEEKRCQNALRRSLLHNQTLPRNSTHVASFGQDPGQKGETLTLWNTRVRVDWALHLLLKFGTTIQSLRAHSCSTLNMLGPRYCPGLRSQV